MIRQAVILAGGRGTRLTEETALRPKPLVEIGGAPILWHIIKIFYAQGVTDFIICLGYKGYLIKEFFCELQPSSLGCNIRFRNACHQLSQKSCRTLAGDFNRYGRRNDNRRASQTHQAASHIEPVLHDLWRRCRRC